MNIVIADDHPLFRSGVRNLLEATEDLIVVGEAGTGAEAIRLAETLRPDVLLLDLRLPDFNGIEVTERLKARLPELRILILSMHKDDKSIFAAMKAGARGYMLKEADGAELLQSIRMVGGGSAVFGAEVATRLAGFFEDKPPEPFADRLTGREREVLGYIADGAGNAEIAARLRLSAKTVANHVANILNKLQVSDRHEARRLVRSYRSDRAD